MGDCDTEQALYWSFIILSLVLTLGVAIYRRKQRNFVDNPGHGKKCYGIMAAIKIIIGTLLLTVLYPKDCVGFNSFYGAVAILIGLYWAYLAVMLGRRQDVNVGSEMPAMSSGAVGKEVV